MISKNDYREILTGALSRSYADQTEILLTSSHSSLTRYANSIIHQNTSRIDDYVQVRAVVGKKIGIASTNQISELDAATEKAYEAAKIASENNDFVSLPKEGSIEVDDIRFSKKTEDFTPNERAEYVKQIVDKSKKFEAAGKFETSSGCLAIANSNGIFSYQRQTEAEIDTIFYSENESSYAFAASFDVDEIDPQKVGEEAYEIVQKSKEPISIDAGRYDVILKPAAVSDLVGFLTLSGFGALSFMEKRSFMSGKIGEKITDNKINIFDDASYDKGMGWLFDYEGVRRNKVDLIKEGIAKAVVYDSFTANKENKANTGHALPATSSYGPLPLNIIMEEGDALLDEMIKSTKKGILINRFHYTNLENPIETVLTGMTRDGSLLIEDGKTTKAINNMRFTQSILKALLKVESISKERTLVSGIGGYYYLPTVKLRDFNFTSAT